MGSWRSGESEDARSRSTMSNCSFDSNGGEVLEESAQERRKTGLPFTSTCCLCGSAALEARMNNRARSHRSQRSIDLLLAANPGATDPEAVIRAKSRDLVTRARALGWQGPPFDMELLASIHGIRVERDHTGEVRDAVLIPDRSGREFRIRVGADVPEERVRYNIPHEITHTFFPDCAVTVRLRGGRDHDDREVEALCDVGASEMLFPLEPFLRDVGGLGGPSFSTLAALRESYHASWEATGNRLAATASDPCAMVILSQRLKPMEERMGPYLPGLGPEPKLRVDYTVRSTPWKGHFVPQHKSIPGDSALYGLLAPLVTAGSPDDSIAATEDWSALKLGKVQVEAMRLASPHGECRLLVFVVPSSGTVLRFGPRRLRVH